MPSLYKSNKQAKPSNIFNSISSRAISENVIYVYDQIIPYREANLHLIGSVLILHKEKSLSLTDSNQASLSQNVAQRKNSNCPRISLMEQNPSKQSLYSIKSSYKFRVNPLWCIPSPYIRESIYQKERDPLLKESPYLRQYILIPKGITQTSSLILPSLRVFQLSLLRF